MAKKAKKAVNSTKQSTQVTAEMVAGVIDAHNARTEGMIKHHLRSVASSTGDLLPEDVTYVISLSNRELGHSIKQLFEPNVL